jgi:hypothetical protein
MPQTPASYLTVFQAPEHAPSTNHSQQHAVTHFKIHLVNPHIGFLSGPYIWLCTTALPAALWCNSTVVCLHRTCCTAPSLPVLPRSFTGTSTTLTPTTSSPAAAVAAGACVSAAAGSTSLPGVLGPSAMAADAVYADAVTASGAAAARSSAEGGGGATGCLGAPCMPLTASSASQMAACV